MDYQRYQPATASMAIPQATSMIDDDQSFETAGPRRHGRRSSKDHGYGASYGSYGSPQARSYGNQSSHRMHDQEHHHKRGVDEVALARVCQSTFGKLLRFANKAPATEDEPKYEDGTFSVAQLLALCPKSTSRSDFTLPSSIDATLFEDVFEQGETIFAPLLSQSMSEEDARFFTHPLSLGNVRRPVVTRGRGRGGKRSEYEPRNQRRPYHHDEDDALEDDLWADPSDETVGKFDASGRFVVETHRKAEQLAIAPEDCLPSYPSWYYRDPSGKLQGPFTNVQMDGWMKAGYFPSALLLQPATDANVDFKPLHEWKAYYAGHLPWSPEAARVPKPAPEKPKDVSFVDPAIVSATKAETVTETSPKVVQPAAPNKPVTQVREVAPQVAPVVQEPFVKHINSPPISPAQATPIKAPAKPQEPLKTGWNSVPANVSSVSSEWTRLSGLDTNKAMSNPWTATTTAPKSAISALLKEESAPVPKTSSVINQIDSIYEQAQYLDVHELPIEDLMKRAALRDALQPEVPLAVSAVNLKKSEKDTKNTWTTVPVEKSSASIKKALKEEKTPVKPIPVPVQQKKPSSWSAVASAASPQTPPQPSQSAASPVKPAAVSAPVPTPVIKNPPAQQEKKETCLTWLTAELKRLNLALDPVALSSLLNDLDVNEAIELMHDSLNDLALAKSFVNEYFAKRDANWTSTALPKPNTKVVKKAPAAPKDDDGFQTVAKKVRKPKAAEESTSQRKVVGLN